jgi:thioredoxin 1
MSIINISGYEEYNRYIESSFCVIKFTAKWCKPCLKLKPFYESLATKYSENILFLEVDIERIQNKKISIFESIKSIPLILFYSNGLLEEDLVVLGYDTNLLEENVKKFSSKISSAKKYLLNINDTTHFDNIKNKFEHKEILINKLDDIKNNFEHKNQLINGLNELDDIENNFEHKNKFINELDDIENNFEHKNKLINELDHLENIFENKDILINKINDINKPE